MTAPSRARSLPWRRGLPARHLEADDAVPHRSCLSPPSTRAERPKLRATLANLKPGDTLVIDKPDRIAEGLDAPPAAALRLQHLAVDGRTAPELQAKSRHQHLASLGRYIQLGEQTSAQVTADADPAAAVNLADPMTGGHPHRTVLVDADRIHGRRHLPAPFAARPAEGSRCETALAGPPGGVWSSPEDAGRVAVDLGEEVVDVR